jgi:uncharacterized protein (DUF2336 family)
MTAHLALLEELNSVVAAGTIERRAELIERLSDLFVFGAASYSDDQIAVFDDVFTRLVATIEVSARALLARRFAEIPLAPPVLSRLLAFDDAIDVAGPMLERSQRLDSGTLAENARIKSQRHLLAISRRTHLDEIVTDVLVERGDRPVVLSTVENPGARFSEIGYGTLVRRSDGDDELANCVGLRRDLPRHQLLRLLTRASEAVRSKLEAADPLSAVKIRSAIAEAVNQVQAKTTALSRDYVAARVQVATLRAADRLNDAAVAAFAEAGKFEETTVALAVLCDLPIEQVELAMAGDRPETVLILAKAIGVSWPTVKKILAMRNEGRGISERELDHCLGTFSRLKPMTARQIMEFQRKRANPGA